ncbi:kanadaptin [Pistacia vera]|uniref:kanadaptin n=1 Tax=Pistacia vera TaxID=55513 RepID=UPI00126389F3|nr:kanadaptin [Pistacia vera]
MTTTAMPPPPPKPPAEEPATSSTSSTTTTTTTIAPMAPPPPPPPPENPNPNPSSENPSADTEEQDKSNSVTQHGSVPYKIPEWSGPPCHKFYVEVLKDGSIVDQFDVCEKGAYMFGRVDLCDFVLEHPTISRFHAVIQFKRSGNAYLYDVGSTHGTSINKNQVQKRVYVDLHVGDVIRFGQSSRLYIFQGPSDLMPPEKDLKKIRKSKIQQLMLDQENSLRRARMDASLADGISWGMGEDAIEEDEDDIDEVTWQTYKGQLTEKQEKTREKVIKRTEKIAHMKREIDQIRAKDIGQGGLTQGQQTQIARNEQRMTQIMEELENLEETLNESIRESIGARSGKISRGKKKGDAEDDEEYLSDDDEFYDRTKKRAPIQKSGENQSIETADTLLDKRDAIMKEMEDKKELLEKEKNKMASETAVETESGDALDAFMSGLSSQLVLDKTEQLQKELSTLQSELDRIFYLLKIADPAGEAAKRRDSKAQEPKPIKSEMPVSAIKKKAPEEPKGSGKSGEPVNVSMRKETTPITPVESNKKPEVDKVVSDTNKEKSAAYSIAKPQWLGAVEDREMKAGPKEEAALNIEEPDQFVDYGDRQKMLSKSDDASLKVDSGIESATSGLILRKKLPVEQPEGIENKALDQSTSSSVGTELKAEDAVALLLKHKRGYHGEDDEGKYKSGEMLGENQPRKDKKKPKRVLGPEKPAFLNSSSDYESWVPPEGQSGDGRTSLNEHYGY